MINFCKGLSYIFFHTPYIYNRDASAGQWSSALVGTLLCIAINIIYDTPVKYNQQIYICLKYRMKFINSFALFFCYKKDLKFTNFLLS